jgi:DNA invertase Pin-like site-specific DNA recombinase
VTCRTDGDDRLRGEILHQVDLLVGEWAYLEAVNTDRADQRIVFEHRDAKCRPITSESPQLEQALALCRKRKARLVIAKLDRLSRNLAFIATLMDSGVEFVAVDNPHATRLTLHILAAVAEHERHMIADRTKAALQAAKNRGIRLGRNGTDRLAPAYRAAAMARARHLAPVLAELKSTGMSARRMATELTARGIPTPNDAKWHGQTVRRMINRVGC